MSKSKKHNQQAVDRGAGSSTGDSQLHQNNNSEDGTLQNSSASQETTAPIPRFLLVKRKNSENEENFDKVNPFIISKVIYGLIGEINSVRKVKDGLLVHTKSDNQANRMLKVTKFNDIEVEVVPHGTLNISKGVIFCKDLLNCTVEEILENLKSIGVIDVRRLKRKIDNTLIDTPNHVLTFNNTKLPTEIKVAYYNLKVRPYIPPPTRCFNCQKFGHVSSKCNGEKLCPCGLPPHESSPCKQPITCVNCEGIHPANDKNCPKYKTEAAIINLKVTERISYGEAKKRVMINTPTRNLSYASAANAASIKNDDLVKQISSQLQDIITKTINQELQNAFKFIQPYPPLPLSPPPQRPKRSRTDTSDVDSVTSESSLSQIEKNKRSKRGWRKGVPRKTSNPDLIIAGAEKMDE